MILIRFGTCSTHGGKFFVWERLYLHGYKWSPLCRVRLQHFHTLNEHRPSVQPTNINIKPIKSNIYSAIDTVLKRAVHEKVETTTFKEMIKYGSVFMHTLPDHEDNNG